MVSICRPPFGSRYSGLAGHRLPVPRVTVTTCGRIRFNRRKINLSQVFAGQILGIKEVDDQIWLVSFLDYDLGYFDANEGRVEPAQNPFTPEQV